MICSIKLLFTVEKYLEKKPNLLFLAAVNSLPSQPVRVTPNFASQTTRPTIWINSNCILEQAEQLFTATVLHPHESNEVKQARNRGQRGTVRRGEGKNCEAWKNLEKHRKYRTSSQWLVCVGVSGFVLVL